MSDERKISDHELYQMYLMELILIGFEDAINDEKLSFEDFMVLKRKGLFGI